MSPPRAWTEFQKGGFDRARACEACGMPSKRSRAHGPWCPRENATTTIETLFHCNALVPVVCVGSSFLPVLAKVEEKTKTCPLLYTARDRHRRRAGANSHQRFRPSRRNAYGARLFSLKTIQIKRLTMILSFCHNRLSQTRGAGTPRFKYSFPHRFRASVF